jgi:hypothetical protein
MLHNFFPRAHYRKVVCPRCRWNCAVPSRHRSGLDLLLALFFLRAFRCRSCHKRHRRLCLPVYSPGLIARATSLRDDLRDQLAIDIGKAHITPVEGIRQPGVIHAKQVPQGRMQS